jgi:hypothetical protein
MGAELHITRAESWWDNDDCQITADEWLNYVASDPELELDPDGGALCALWSGPSEYKPRRLDWSQGNISAKWPVTPLYLKMLTVAAALGAKVLDEDDRIYSEEGDYEFNPPVDYDDIPSGVSQEIDIDGAERSLSLLGKFMAVGYIGLLLWVVLIAWLGSPDGQKGPYDSFILLLVLVSTVALLLCPFLIGMVATRIGKNGTVWGGLSFIFSPVGSLIGYFKIKSAVDEAATAAARSQGRTNADAKV